jgi:hypothetical protein
MRHGGDRKSKQDQEANWPLDSKVTLDTAAKRFNVSERSIKRARKIQSAAAPELIEAVDEGRAGQSFPLRAGSPVAELRP